MQCPKNRRFPKVADRQPKVQVLNAWLLMCNFSKTRKTLHHATPRSAHACAPIE